jgi:1-acyl-sn-glycerol-3-phosphate acyltransferase
MATELTLGLLLYLPCRVLGIRQRRREVRARWLQQVCRRLLRIFRTRIRVDGAIPASGLVVSNHLSYMDILVICATTPAVFVAKHEVRSWPVFGWFAILAGTVFVDRDRRSAVATVANEVESALREGALVVLFPEGTSSDGSSVLPFKPSLLQPVVQSNYPVTAARIEYELIDGNVGTEVCYWGDMTLMPHLLNLMRKPSLMATLRFHTSTAGREDRKGLARQIHAEVMQLGRN